MLEASSPTAIIADEPIVSRLDAVDAAKKPSLVIRTSEISNSNSITRWLRRKREFSESSEPWSLGTVGRRKRKEPAYVIFTSGTTSRPKGVVVSRRALRYHVSTLAQVFNYGADARLLCYLPTHHTDGLVHGVAASLLTGMTIIHPGPFQQSSDVAADLRDNKITHFLAVPTMLAMIKRTLGDCSSLFQLDDFKCLASTAGYLDEKLWEDIENLFGIRLSNFYGMTETVSGSLYCGPDDASYRLGTLGKPVDADLRIIDENGSEVAVDTVGQLQISGKHMMTGYLDDTDATDAVLDSGWLSTGDLFRSDSAGFYYFAGRLKSIIKRGGITVYPEDIRKVVCAVPGVKEAEVVGLPNAVFEEIIAVAVIAEGSLNIDDIRISCNKRLAPERRPDVVEVLPELPRGPSGKVLQDELIATLTVVSAKGVAPDNSVSYQVVAVAAKTFSVDIRELDNSSSPESIENWDSYAGMEFVLALEKQFSLRLSARSIMQIDSIGKAIETITIELDSSRRGQ